VIVYAVVHDAPSPDFPLGVELRLLDTQVAHEPAGGSEARGVTTGNAAAQEMTALGVRDDLANLDARDGDRFGNDGAPAEPVGSRPSSVLRFEHEHRQPIASIIGSSPVASDEAGGARDLGHHLLAKSLLSDRRIADGDPQDYGVHLTPSIEGWASRVYDAAGRDIGKRR